MSGQRLQASFRDRTNDIPRARKMNSRRRNIDDASAGPSTSSRVRGDQSVSVSIHIHPTSYARSLPEALLLLDDSCDW